MSTLIRKHPDVEIDVPNGGHRIIHNRSTRKYFKLGIREADFLEALDGSRDATTLRNQAPGGFSAEQVDFLLNWLAAQGLLAGAASETPPQPVSRRVMKWLNPNAWQFTLCDPDRFLESRLAWVHACFSRPALLLYLVVLFAPIVLYALAPALFAGAFSLATPDFNWKQWLGVYVAMLFMIAGHEMAHAVTCKHFGGAVHKIGVKLLYLQPVVFCDISASWRFQDVNHKVAAAAAGIFVQLLVSSLVVIAWTVLHWPTLWYFAAINIVIALINLFPFIKLDGYWILVHLSGRSDLMPRGRAAVDAVLLQLVGRKPAKVRFSAGLFAYGLACRIAAIAFWLLGLFALQRYASMISPSFGDVAVTLFSVLMAMRVLQALSELSAQFATSAKA
jgi:putative peptide zinc metalloprotease protein